jgi:hypothetical protein
MSVTLLLSGVQLRGHRAGCPLWAGLWEEETLEMIVVELFESFDASWWWRAERCRLLRGPFTDRAAADADAIEVAPDLIAALAAGEAEGAQP